MTRFDIKLHMRNTPEDVLLQDLQRVARQTRESSPSTTVYDENGCVSAGTIIRRFGSWNAALLAAGLPTRRDYRIHDIDLFDNLARLWGKLGRQPISVELI